MKDIVLEIRRQYEELGARMGEPEVASDHNAYRELAREHSRLGKILEVGDRYIALTDEIAEQKELLASDDDPEMQALIGEELPGLESELKQVAADLEVALLPHDPNDDRDVILEVRAGTGGDEAALFAEEVARMYLRYAEKQGWKHELIDGTPGTSGGMKEVVHAIKGEGVFGILRYESGVHRVQRVPATESQGRIHTSAVTVAVLPEAEEVDIDIRNEDLRIDVYRAQGPGGQSVNTTDSAVRITHVPTGLVVQCQDEKSQHKNKAKAMGVLRSRLLEQAILEQEQEIAAERRSQVGTGDRSAKIRTYNFPQSRVTDHRIGLTVHNLDAIMAGDLDEVVAALQEHRRQEGLAASQRQD